jgi:hypothetical protein
MNSELENYVFEYIKCIPFDSIEREKENLDQDILIEYNNNKAINSKIESICKDYVNVKKNVIQYKNELDKLYNRLKSLPNKKEYRKLYKKKAQEYRDVEYTYDKFYDKYCLLRERFYKQYYQKYKISKKIQYKLKRKCHILNKYSKQWSEFINHIPKSTAIIHGNESKSVLRIDENGPPSSRTRSKFLNNK